MGCYKSPLTLSYVLTVLIVNHRFYLNEIYLGPDTLPVLFGGFDRVPVQVLTLELCTIGTRTCRRLG